LDLGWISSIGKFINIFEEKFAEFCGTKYAMSVSNGTVGLHLALKTLDIKNGDEVIIPDLTFVATANAVITAGATPIMVDIDKVTFCIDPENIIKKINKNTKAIIPVHLFGHPAEMNKINQIANKYKLFVIEDAAEAHGASINGKKVGSFGDFGVFSFYGNKIITTGEGGMLTTDNEELFCKAKLLRDHAMSKTDKYWHSEIGYNYRMTNLQAAIGLAQLEKIDSFLSIRNEILENYKSLLSASNIELNQCVDCIPSNWLVSAVITSLTRSKRDNLIKLLYSDGIDTRPFFYPLTMLPMYKDETFNYNISNYISSIDINLPTYLDIKQSEIITVVNSLIKNLERL